jgi:diguanylate cyclase (GGDEF)-like protein
MNREHIRNLVWLHDTVERAPELQARVDAARLSWVMRRMLGVFVLLYILAGLAGLTSFHAVWPLALLIGLALTEIEIRCCASASDLEHFERWLLATRATAAVLVAVVAPLIAGPGWLIPLVLTATVAATATQLSARSLAVLVGVSSGGFLLGSALVGSGLVEPLSGAEVAGPSVVGTLTVSFLVLPGAALFVLARSRAAAEQRRALEATVVELSETDAQLRTARAEAERLTEQLSGEVARKTEELERRNRALSIVNAVSFALSESVDEEAAIDRAARIVAKLMHVDAVQLREAPLEGSTPFELIVTATPGAPEPTSLPADLLDGVARDHNRVVRSDELEPAGERSFVVVPMMTQGTVRGTLALIGQQCAAWGEQEFHLLALIGREMGAALESSRLYREAVTAAEREHLLTEATGLLSEPRRLHEQLDAVLALIGRGLSPAFASIVAIEGDGPGPELARWLPPEVEATEADALSAALRSLIPASFPDRAEPLVLKGGSVTGSVPATLGTVVLAPIATARIADDGGALDEEPPQLATASKAAPPGAVLTVGFAAGDACAASVVEPIARLAGPIGRRLEAEQLVRLQQRRMDELAGLAEIGRVTQSGVDSDRLELEFACALQRLVPYDQLYIARVHDRAITQVPVFVGNGRSRTLVPSAPEDSEHAWFNTRHTVAWRRSEEEPPPSFVAPEASSGIAIPMRPKGQLLGVVVLAGSGVAEFSVRLAERAVEQLSLALDSAELYRQATERASRIQAQSNLASIVASAVDLREAFDAFSEEIRWLIPFERAVMLMVDETRGVADEYATYPPADEAPAESALIAGSPVATILEAGGPVALRRNDAAVEGLDWSIFGAGVTEVAAVPVREGGATTAVFALVHSGRADYDSADLVALEEVSGLLGVTMDRLRLYERAEHAARHDLLTGLPNYRALQERLAAIAMHPDDETRTALLMVDMDGLKVYNDTLGHDAGDRAIRRVAEELRNAVRIEDFVARTGGDEFVVVMEGVEEDEALVVAQRMHDALRDVHHEFGNAPVPVRISIGLAFAPDDGTGASELLEAADRAMYAAKFGGGDRTRAAAGERGESGSRPRTLRRRSHRVMELLIRAAVEGASGPERLAIALAQRYVVAVALGKGLPVDTADALRMLVAAEAAYHIQAPDEYRDQETALLLLEGLRAQWKQQLGHESFPLDELLPAAVRLAWEQIPAPEGPGLDAEAALGIIRADPAYHLGEDALELLNESARTAEFERRRSRREAA